MAKIEAISGMHKEIYTVDHDVGLTPLGKIKIELTFDIAVYHKPYRLSLAKRRGVWQKVQTLLYASVIQER